MARKLSSRAYGSIGRPGYKMPRAGGGFVNRTKASKFGGVRRLIARNPADAKTNLNQILGFTNDPDVPNVNAAPNPRILKAPGPRRSVVMGIEHVVNRATNRRIRVTGTKARRKGR